LYLAKHSKVRFYPTAATAQREGFRACKRCRPDTVPGSPEWDARADAVGRAMRLIADGVVDSEGVAGLALDPGSDREEAGRRLLALRGVGPWTASYVAMRALGDPDAFLPTDLGVRRAVAGLGGGSDPASVTALARRWRPWRAYATQHLWASL
jgi:AraC family transcriptional regulator of adaptative response / DNA-3-methyladenine glycosylase II